MYDVTVADELEFESWPEEKQKLAYKYVLAHTERHLRFDEDDLADAMTDGIDIGRDEGRHEAIAKLRKALDDFIINNF